MDTKQELVNLVLFSEINNLGERLREMEKWSAYQALGYTPEQIIAAEWEESEQKAKAHAQAMRIGAIFATIAFLFFTIASVAWLVASLGPKDSDSFNVALGLCLLCGPLTIYGAWKVCQKEELDMKPTPCCLLAEEMKARKGTVHPSTKWKDREYDPEDDKPKFFTSDG